MPLGFGLSLNPRRSGASGPVNSATYWGFAQFGLAGTPWADVSRTGLGTRVDSAGLVGFGPHNLAYSTRVRPAALPLNGGTTPPTVSVAAFGGYDCLAIAFASGVTGYGAAHVAPRYTDGMGSWSVTAGTAYGYGVRVGLSRALVGGEQIFIQYAGSNSLVVLAATSATAASGAVLSATSTPAATGVQGLQIWSAGTALTAPVTLYVMEAFVQVGATAPTGPQVQTTTGERYLPRITHDPVTLSALGLLVEGQGTNVLAQPANPSVSPWTGSASAVQAADYQGLPTWTLTKTTTSSFEERRSGAFTAVVSTYTYLVIAYAGTSTQLDFLVYNDGAGNRGTGHVLTVLSGPGSVAVGALFHQLTGLSSTVPTVVQVTFTSSAGLSRLSLCPGGASSTTIGHSVRVQLRNIETGSVATSYIPNPGTGSAVRVADDWFLSGTAFSNIYNPAEGTLFIACTLSNIPSLARLMEITGATPGTHRMLVYTSSTQILFQVRDSTDQAVLVAALPAAANAEMRIGVTYKANEFRISVNGSAVVEDTAGSLPTGMNSLSIGWAQSGASDRAAQTAIRAARYIPSALSAAALQALTA